MSEAIAERKPLPAIVAGNRVQAIVPTDFDSAYRIAQAVCHAGMAPESFDTPEKAFVAVMHGLEVGLPPMQALQSIAVINGRPSIWGDGAIGLVRGSGLCEWISERIDGEGDARVAICEAKRRGEPKPVVGKFSVGQAKLASLWSKKGPWTSYPERMLQMRARAFALRDGFADVLRGLHIAEEVQDIIEPRDITPPPASSVPPSPPQVTHVKSSAQGQRAKQDDAKPEDEHRIAAKEGREDSGVPFHMLDEHDMAPADGDEAAGESEAVLAAPAPQKPRKKATKPVEFDSAAWAEKTMKALRAADSAEDVAKIEADLIAPHIDDANPLDAADVRDVLAEIKAGME
jgi:hypothetical protein